MRLDSAAAVEPAAVRTERAVAGEPGAVAATAGAAFACCLFEYFAAGVVSPGPAIDTGKNDQ